MKQLLLSIALITSAQLTFAQTTWSDDVALIIYDNCTSCHRPGGIGPFTLMDYTSAAAQAYPIVDAASSGYMPPWSPDPSYQTYAHERLLTSDEIETLVNWMAEGSLEGNPDLAPPAPVYPEDGFILNPPDLEVQIPTYTSQATNFSDDYVCISMPLGLTSSKKLRAFEVVPGNPEVVHHCLLYIDETGEYESDLSGYCVGPTDGLIGGYTPGAVPTIFPSDGVDMNMGVIIPAGSNLVLAMHFPEGSAGETDDTKVRLYFYEDDVPLREITTSPILQNWSFQLQAEEVTSVEAEYNAIPQDISLLSIFPHMHLLGHKIKSYGVPLEGDTIPLVDVPHWDFEWQQFYAFEALQIIPAWTNLIAEGEFDNTSFNTHNPNDPPINVYPGLNTSDEMFLVYFQFLVYENGDENLDINALTNLPVFIEQNHAANGTMEVNAFPNPFTEFIQLEMELTSSSVVSLYVYDQNGRRVAELANKENLGAGNATFEWKPEQGMAKGTYFYSLRVNAANSSGVIQFQ